MESERTTKPAPFERLFAKGIDILLYLKILIVTVTFVSEIDIFSLNFSIVAIVFFIIAESLVIFKFGTTFGNFLFNIRITDANGKNLTIDKAFLRTILLYTTGMGLLIPFLAIITGIYWYYQLNSKGTTLWDTKAGSIVTIGDINEVRVFFILISFMTLLMIQFL